MFGWLKRLFAPPPSALELLGETLSRARIEAARLHAIAVVGAERLHELDELVHLWQRRCHQTDRGLSTEASRIANALEARAEQARYDLVLFSSYAWRARERVDAMLRDFERLTIDAATRGARVPLTVIDDGAAERIAFQEARDLANIDRLSDETELDFYDRLFRRLEHAAMN